MKSCKSDDISGALIGEPRRAVAQLCVYQLRSDVLSTSFWHRNKVNKASLLASTYASGRRTEDQTRLGSTPSTVHAFRATCLAGLIGSLTLACLMWPRHGSLLRLLSVSALFPAVLAIWPFPERQYKVEGWINSGQLGLDIKGSVVALGDWDGDQ